MAAPKTAGAAASKTTVATPTTESAVATVGEVTVGEVTVEEVTVEEFQQVINVNLMGQVYRAKAALPYLRREGQGALIHISSIEAIRSMPYHSAYAASKRGVLQLTEALAAELREHNITANAILPSVIDTPANRKSNPDADHTRWVKPEDIARVILFLVGPDARIVSGTAIPVYGRA